MIVFDPPDSFKKSTSMYKFLQLNNLSTFDDLYQKSIENPEWFWRAFVSFRKVNGEFSGVFAQDYDDFLKCRFFPESKVSLMENIPKNDSLAIVDLNQTGKEKIKITYNSLHQLIEIWSRWLRATDCKRVFCVLPNSPAAVCLFLACAANKVLFSIVGPENGYKIISDRVGLFKPDLLVLIDKIEGKGYYFDHRQLLQQISQEHLRVCRVTIFDNNFFSTLERVENPEGTVRSLNGQADIYNRHEFNTPLAALFTSGTTGKPKGIVHGLGSFLLENLKELSLHSNIGPESRLFYYTSPSWMMWYWMLGGLFQGATVYLYSGDPLGPDGLRLWQIVEEERINFFGTSARHIALSQKRWRKGFDFQNLEAIFSTGSPLLEHNFDFIYESVKSDVMLYSISGGTDILGCFALGAPILPIKKGRLQCRSLAYEVDVFNEDGRSIIGEPGELVCKRPMLSKPLGFLQDPNNRRFFETYFSKYPNIWAHGDYAILYEDGSMKILGRSDATIKPKGVRVGTSEIYEVVENIPGVIECIAAGKITEEGDEEIALFVVLDEYAHFESIKEKITKAISEQLSRFHVPKHIVQVSSIPKTKNNKPVEILIKKLINGGSNLADFDEFSNVEEFIAPFKLDQSQNG